MPIYQVLYKPRNPAVWIKWFGFVGETCRQGFIACDDLSKCYREEYFCDAFDDCEDGSDEPVPCGEYQCLVTLGVAPYSKLEKIPICCKVGEIFTVMEDLKLKA